MTYPVSYGIIKHNREREKMTLTPHDLEIQEMIDYDNKVPANKVSKFEAVIEVIMVRDNVYRVCGRVTDIE